MKLDFPLYEWSSRVNNTWKQSNELTSSVSSTYHYDTMNIKDIKQPVKCKFIFTYVFCPKLLSMKFINFLTYNETLNYFN